MTLAVIVQARAGSSRLPRKVLEPLGDKCVLDRVLDRCRRIAAADHVICAIPEGEADDPVADAARRAGVAVFRGSEQDVLARYLGAAKMVDADEVVRITSDCPFIDPGMVDQLVALYRESAADYANNTLLPGFPRGLDCEIVSTAWLERADAEATDPADREHVTAWIRNRPGLKLACLEGPGGEAANWRWTLDYPADLAFCRAVFERAGEAAAELDFPALSELCRKAPDLVAINAVHADPARPDIRRPAAIVRDYLPAGATPPVR
ncbi:glycosyltransferase family protein [Maricaulis sp.]|uniref:glycosyltransferase family protein n=1 Tax=Maricaulis sp. TaxID=1486257 RepID=UPI001B11FF9D|nr:glycosyltransferase family protein [Maricaulis sp.]MBO6766258.1 glycosyltransferase family protein [Maricaulis sp.]